MLKGFVHFGANSADFPMEPAGVVAFSVGIG